MVGGGESGGGRFTVTPVAADEVAEEANSVLEWLSRRWWLVLIVGVVTVAIGVVMLLRPFGAVRVAAVLLGIWLLVSGVVQLVQAFDKTMDNALRALSAISGVIGIVLGIICFDSVEDRLALLTLFVGIWWVLRGIWQVLAAVGESGTDGWMIFLGVTGILAGIVVLVWSIESLIVLAVVVGLWLVILGLMEVVSSFRLRSAAIADEAGLRL